MSRINGKIALVTGANRGIGRSFVLELLNAGATKVYATARRTETLDDLVADGNGKVVAVQLDVTDKARITELAASSKDVELLINNAGIALFQGIVSAPDDKAARSEMETNYFGVFEMTRAFAPILKSNGGGVIVNISSIAGHVNFPALGSYSASKAAVHSLTQSIRAELAAQETHVLGVYPGPVDTDMASQLPMDKTAPEDVAKSILEALEAGMEDIYPDPASENMHSAFLSDPKALEKEAGQMLPA